MSQRATVSVILAAWLIGLAPQALAQSTFAPADKQKTRPPPTTKFAPPPKGETQAAPAPRKEAPRTPAAQSSGPPNALQGFSQNKDQPVKIAAASLEVRDKDRVATFTGDVQLSQGDTALRCSSLVVYYEDDTSKPAMTAASPLPGGAQRIRRLEARGNVRVTQKEQIVTGDTGIFDMRANTVTLTGNVAISSGQNFMRGAQRLTVDLVNGVSRMDGGRVEGVFQSEAPPSKSDGGSSPDFLKLPRARTN